MEFDKLYNKYIYSPYNYCEIDNRMIYFSSKNKTGVTVIDEQHKSFAGAINMLFDCLRRDPARKLALPAIRAFKYNMGVHYQTERLVMAFSDAAYEALYDIKYTELCRRLVVVECRIRKDFDMACLVRFLKAWWLQHMESHAEFFRPYTLFSEQEH